MTDIFLYLTTHVKGHSNEWWSSEHTGTSTVRGALPGSTNRSLGSGAYCWSSVPRLRLNHSLLWFITSIFLCLKEFRDVIMNRSDAGRHRFTACMISGFQPRVNETCALLGYYAAQNGRFQPTFRDRLSRNVGKTTVLRCVILQKSADLRSTISYVCRTICR